MSRNMLTSALGNLTDYLAYIIVALMVIIFIIIVVVAVKKRKKTVGYTSDEIDRSVDEAARKKAAERDEVKEEQPVAIEAKKEQKKETVAEKPAEPKTEKQPKQEKPVEKKEQPKQEKPAEKKEQPKQEKPAEKKEQPKQEKPAEKKEQPKQEKPAEKAKAGSKAQKVTPVEVDEDDTGEELTFEADDIDEPEQKETPKRKISYRILYDRETKTWEVRKDQAKRVIRRVKTKKEALEIAQELCERQELNLVVHKKDGKFQKRR